MSLLRKVRMPFLPPHLPFPLGPSSLGKELKELMKKLSGDKESSEEEKDEKEAMEEGVEPSRIKDDTGIYVGS